MADSVCDMSATRAGSPAKITRPYICGAAASNFARLADSVRSACSTVACFCHLAPRSRLQRWLITSRASSASNRSATADPIPPEPPTSTTSLPLSESGVDNIFLQRQIAAGHYDQKHRQYFAIAKVEFDYTFRHRCQHYGNAAMQQIAPIARPR